MKLAVLVLVGIPGAGKTTLATLLSQQYSEDYCFLHVCYDSLLPACQEGASWREARLGLVKEIDLLLKSLTGNQPDACPVIFRNMCAKIQNFDKPVVIIIDDNMYYKSMRYCIYSVARNNAIGYCQCFMNASVNRSMAVNNERCGSSKVPSHIVENMAKKIEPPNVSVNWERNSLFVQSYEDIHSYVGKLLGMLKHVLANPEQAKTDGPKLIVDQSVLHKVDIAVRKVISKEIARCKATMDAAALKNLSAKLTEAKKIFLLNVKDGIIVIPDDTDLSEGLHILFVEDLFLSFI